MRTFVRGVRAYRGTIVFTSSPLSIYLEPIPLLITDHS